MRLQLKPMNVTPGKNKSEASPENLPQTVAEQTGALPDVNGGRLRRGLG